MAFYHEKGTKRLINAVLFSITGFKSTWKYEEAFRQEIIVTVFLIPVALWASENYIEKILLIGSMVLVLIVEILNSAIEAVVDRSGDEFHELAGRAKDMGSAAVMLTILTAIITWLAILT